MDTTGAASTAQRFICDAMLGRLARCLRAAGYDTLLATAESDRDLLALARQEARLLLTCDRYIIDHRNARQYVVLLPQSDLDTLVRHLMAHRPIDWLSRAFSRCLLDNAILETAGPAQRARLPCLVEHEPAMHCPHCDRLYWAGAHYRRLRHRLEGWQALN
jgi:uncharacterized protein with PIN domain